MCLSTDSILRNRVAGRLRLSTMISGVPKVVFFLLTANNLLLVRHLWLPVMITVTPFKLIKHSTIASVMHVLRCSRHQLYLTSVLQIELSSVYMYGLNV